MGRCILITSGKGGVGKTSLTANLATALSKMGYDTVAIDANLTTPNLGIHLGMHLVTKTLHDVLRGEEKVERALYPHPLGFKVMPGSISVHSLRNVRYERLTSVVLKLLSQFEFVLVDSAAGLGEEYLAALDSASEVLIVTNPDLPSVTDALKTVKHAERKHKRIIGIVVNRVRRLEHELSEREIEDMFGIPVIGAIPEDLMVAKSIARKIPVVHSESNSPAAREIKRVAHKLVGKHYYESDRASPLGKFFKLFG